eukprot:GILI01018980.1.p1 GENE.GILI01018980.1~~GILI01018980.1.p1  ORF type:complete len:134 (+),score=11.37 GILI01018980.1:2-403(+)
MAMRQALAEGGISPNQVSYVNAHATSTPMGDTIECQAIHRVCGSAVVSSTKGAIGHLLGAAGAVEAVFSVLSLQNAIAPHTLNLVNRDPAIPSSLDLPGHNDGPKKLSNPIASLSNSFGFGGTNCTLLFSISP